ncbi:PAP1-domain-containing protein [Myriangium duriaei CBS 260.36]|uniref:PAP1-domain-containing protein n=1 Tax=Myriangium duriaei CBS 260.36 TaxID=1168546 RepID=A0A9P4IX92_9PEZI|nr:PAP1-domain-containing protein [Myriangium duriaei CBS 260.36]
MAGLDTRDPRYLTNNQQDLLRAALVSNKPQQRSSEPQKASMSAFDNQLNAASAIDGVTNFDDFDPNDPLLTSFYEGDTSFDLDNSGVSLGDIEVNEIHDKRKASDASPDSDEGEQGDPKRREGEDKQAKKPGRKPLTTEPTTKRKAQNRAAQRAFRERKEKHLKDLETKVDELTKASEADKQENGILKAQVERLQSELSEYRKRMSTDSNRGSPATTYKPANRSDFTFQFPAFGTLPAAGPQLFGTKGMNYIKRESNDAGSSMPPVARQDSGDQRISPGHNISANASPTTNAVAEPNNMQSFAGLFSPGILNGAAVSSNSPDYGFPRASASPVMRENSTTSIGSRAFRFNSESASSNNDSPSQSSMSQFNTTSSCNTSPAPSQHPSPLKDSVPNNNPGLTSINELSALNSQSTPASSNSIDWLVSQNGGQFDPVLFGDYRESQDAIVGDGDFNNGFFNEAFPFDINSPLNFMDSASPKPAPTVNARTAMPPSAGKSQDKPEACKKLLAELEKSQAGGDDDYGLATAKDKNGAMLSANAIWNQLQSNKDFQDGKFDLDGLCSELRSKAKCSESGMAVPAAAVESTFKKLSGKTVEEDHNLIWDEAFVNSTFDKLGANTQANWGGFGLTNEQLSQGW